jgi:hypothetical protein
MSGTSELFLNQAIEFWQPLASRRLTREDVRQITENLGGPGTPPPIRPCYPGTLCTLRSWATRFSST